MAEAAVTFFLENVKKLLVDQVHIISGAENELKQLENELELMKAFLKESANKREKGDLYRQFEKQIRDVVYQAENTIDSCLTEAAAPERSRSKRRLIIPNKIDPKRLKLAREVKSLREESVKPIFDQAKINFATLQIADPAATTAQEAKEKAKKTPLLRQDNVVGFDGEADAVIGCLNQESCKLAVISIIGMPGLGKTTLAWKIYRDERIKYEFPIRIWVYVSQEFNRRDVFLNILKKFTHQDMSSKNDNELADMVRSNLETAKFLLVMDDVWTPDAWKEIIAALPNNNSSGRVLITSRHERVARQANCLREPHRLRFLDPNDSWKLLQLEVFGKVDECPEELKTLGKAIAEECDGVPLAIVVIGGILAEKFSTVGGIRGTREEWKKVSLNVSSYINNDPEERTKKIIALSYNKLPHYLRDCFLYLGMFPEDTEIPVWKLTRLWIAEGFIQQKPDKSVEEVAEDNLKDLISRNLVMVDKTKAEGEVKTCRVHDMIREFCKNEAAIAEQNLFQEIKKSKEGVFDPPVPEIQKHRRLCIHSYVLDFLQKKPKGPWVRSLLCFSKDAINLPVENNALIVDAFNLLRVLDVNPIKFTKFPSLAELIHLRYIALTGDNFKALPDAVSWLWNLQTIRIDTMEREIRADIWKMTQLRHFKTKAAIILNKEVQGEAGENLQTLSRLAAQCCTEEVFNRAPNLTNLGICGQLAMLLDSRCLEKLHRLQKLKLVYDVFPTVASEKPLRGLPQPNRFPPDLRILELSATFLEWKHMSTLGMLGGLEVLKLKENAFIGEHWGAVGGEFPSLEFLLIARTDLKVWTASGDPFPQLRCLVLKTCEKLEEIPSLVAKNLEILEIEHVHKSTVASARKIEEEKQQMQGQKRTKSGGFKLILAPGDDT